MNEAVRENIGRVVLMRPVEHIKHIQYLNARENTHRETIAHAPDHHLIISRLLHEWLQSINHTAIRHDRYRTRRQ